MKKQHYLILLTLAACATQTTKRSEESLPTTSTSPTSGPVIVKPSESATLPNATATATSRKAPELNLPVDATEEMQRALALFQEYANSDELFDYVRVNVPKVLEGGNETDRDLAIVKTRDCFSRLGPINVRLKNYGLPPFYKSNAIGGWDGVQINQNRRYHMAPEETAGHWAHELTHACKFTHISNNITLYPIIRKSWPYKLGHAFEDFLIEKKAPSLAGEL